MRFVRSIMLSALFIVSLGAVTAQDDAPAPEAYDWSAAGIRFEYPANWDNPLPVEGDGQVNLQLAQAFIDTPLEARPPGIPLIHLTFIAGGAIGSPDLTPPAAAGLQAVGIDTLAETSDSTLLGGPATDLTGTSADGQLFGLARAAVIGLDDVLIVVGRAAAAQRDDFLTVFDQVASSITSDSADAGAYGILWYTIRSVEDGEEAFLDLIGLADGPDNRLYTFERDLGVVEIDAATGSILNITPNENITAPTGIAVTSTGTVYVSDTDCGCIYTLTGDGLWLDQAAEAALEEGDSDNTIPEETVDNPDAEPADAEAVDTQRTGVLGGFNPGAPAHIAVGPDDTLYATDITSADIVVVVTYAGDARDRTIRVDNSLFEQPLLATAPGGQVIALSQFGELFALTAATTAESMGTTGPATGRITSFTLTPEDTVAIATEGQGVTLLTMEGEFVTQVGSVVPGFPLPGEFVSPSGVVSSADGTLYIADSDGSFGAITAMSTQVPQDRLGATTLTPGLGVQGILNEATPQQTWIYHAAAGDTITITALENTGVGDLNVALRLLGPDGNEIAANDDHESLDILNFSDAQIANHRLEADGDYIIRVERMSGDGAYALGLSLTRPIEFDADGVGSATGQLGFTFPVEYWQIAGRAGQTLTLTLEPTSGDLDPILRLVGPDGTILDQNDDAFDVALAPAAQLVNVSLPADGLYTLEAARFDGAGRYELTIVATS